MCFVEIIDTAGQGMFVGETFNLYLIAFLEEYATLRDQWIR